MTIDKQFYEAKPPERLCEIRRAKGLSQGDIEKRTGLLRCYISRVENGYTVPSIGTLERMAKALEIEMYQFFFEGDKEPKAIPVESRDARDPKEDKLVGAFGNLNRKDKEFILATAQRLARAG